MSKRRFNKGDIVTLRRDDIDCEVICCDDNIAVLAHTYLRLDNVRHTNYEDISVYSNALDLEMQEYDVIFKA